MDGRFFEDDALANAFQKTVEHRTMVNFAAKQTDLLYMAGEKGRRPMLREDAVDTLFDGVVNSMNWFIADMVSNLIRRYAAQDIDVPIEVADWYNEYNGYMETDDGYIEGKAVDHALE